MDDGLVAVLTELTYAKLNWDEIAHGMKCRKSNPGQFDGMAAKYGLRTVVQSLIKNSGGWAQPLVLPKLSYGVHHDDGAQILFSGHETERHLTTCDSFLAVNNRPIAVDIRISPWRITTHHTYFKKQDIARSVVLDDLFGKEKYDRVLVVPGAESKVYHGVHIVRPSFSLDDYRAQAKAAAEKCMPVKNQASDST